MLGEMNISRTSLLVSGEISSIRGMGQQESFEAENYEQSVQSDP